MAMDDELNGESRIRDLSVLEGNKKNLSVRANDIHKELSESVIPTLTKERDRLWREKVALGAQDSTMKRDNPPPRKAKEALLRAVEIVGGEFFVSSKRRMERLEGLEQNSKKTLDYLEVRYKGARKISPMYFREKHRLEKEHKKIITQLNEATLQYNHRVNYLNLPENQNRITEIAEKLLVEDTRRDIKLREVERSFAKTEKALERAYDIKRSVKDLGDTRLRIREVTLRVDSGAVRIPVPKIAKELEQSNRQNIVQNRLRQKITR